MSLDVKNIPVTYLLATPTTPTVANQGTPDTTTYSYKVVDYDNNGGVVLSAEGTTTTGAAALDGTDFNRLTLVPNAKATTREIWLTDGPAALGLLGTVDPIATTYDDQVGIGDGATLPTAATTGIGAWVECPHMSVAAIQASGTFTATMQIQSTVDGANPIDEGSALTATTAAVDLTGKFRYAVRSKMTAYTSGTPTLRLAGR